MIKEAIILAGGLGTRLRSVVSDVPKCMAPVNGIPFSIFIITYLQKEGVDRFIFSLGYKSEIMIDYVNKTFPDLDKEFVIEDSPLGTGGAIKLACSKAKNTDVLILNGDTLFNINLKELSEFHRNKKADFTVALKEMRNFSRYGSVEIDKNFAIKAFHEKTYCEKGFINGGVYALRVNSFMNEVFLQNFLLRKIFGNKYWIRKIFRHYAEYYFIDIGIPEDYDRFIRDFNLIFDKSKYHKKDTGDYMNAFIGDFF
ncbi:MAG: NTP transferase domain-containing protein [Chitinophagaceae bacterium]|nr:NTP transferase domain-containing protein [Chitinophagaceae bacterium]